MSVRFADEISALASEFQDSLVKLWMLPQYGVQSLLLVQYHFAIITGLVLNTNLFMQELVFS